MRFAVALAILVAPLVAHATLGIVTGGALFKSASRVAIAIADGHGKAKVTTAYRGTKVGDVLDLAPGPAGATLVVCDGDDCGSAIDLGGFYVLHLPGRKGPILTEPGLYEAGSLAALVAGTGAKPLCLRANLHLIDEPSADVALEGAFSAEDGTGTITLDGVKLHGTLTVGGPVHAQETTATLRLDNGLALVGGPIARTADHCFAFPALPSPLARSKRQLAKATKEIITVELARGALRGQRLSIATDGTLTSPIVTRGDLVELITTDHSIHLAYTADGGGTLLLTIRARPPFSEAVAAAQLGEVLADGKPHDVEIAITREVLRDGVEPKVAIKLGTGSLQRVLDPK